MLAPGSPQSIHNLLSGHTIHTHTVEVTERTVLELPRLTKENQVADVINEKCSDKLNWFVIYLRSSLLEQLHSRISLQEVLHSATCFNFSHLLINVQMCCSYCNYMDVFTALTDLFFSLCSALAPSCLHKSKTNPPSASSSLLICLPALRP